MKDGIIMPNAKVDKRERSLLVAFFVLTFAITWGLALLIVLFPGPLTALFGPVSAANPLFILAVAGPTVAATILTAMRAGRTGLRALYSGLTRWRFGIGWYAAILAGIPLIAFAVSQVAGAERKANLGTPALLVAFLLNQLILGPLGEELGWRGFALPRLLKRFSPLVASLILGVIWGVWHLPAFFVSGLPQTSLALPVFLLNVLFLSILATWIYRGTGGSVLSVALFHFAVNCAIDAFGAPLLPFMLAMAVAATLVVTLDSGADWFQHESSRDGLAVAINHRHHSTHRHRGESVMP
jgi:membrane protease YdiL (CAAX protease family)